MLCTHAARRLCAAASRARNVVGQLCSAAPAVAATLGRWVAATLLLHAPSLTSAGWPERKRPDGRMRAAVATFIGQLALPGWSAAGGTLDSWSCFPDDASHFRPSRVPPSRFRSLEALHLFLSPRADCLRPKSRGVLPPPLPTRAAHVPATELLSPRFATAGNRPPEMFGCLPLTPQPPPCTASTQWLVACSCSRHRRYLTLTQGQFPNCEALAAGAATRHTKRMRGSATVLCAHTPCTCRQCSSSAAMSVAQLAAGKGEPLV